MIKPALLRTYASAMAAAIGCNPFQESQNAPRPEYPILGFKLIVQDVDEEYMARVSTADVSASETEKTTSLHNHGTLSISVRDKTSSDTVADKTEAALNWMLSQAGKEAAATAGFVARRFSTTIEDRTVQLEDEDYEFRWGFDVRVDHHHTRTETIERVQSVGITVESPPYPAEQIEVSP